MFSLTYPKAASWDFSRSVYDWQVKFFFFWFVFLFSFARLKQHISWWMDDDDGKVK